MTGKVYSEYLTRKEDPMRCLLSTVALVGMFALTSPVFGQQSQAPLIWPTPEQHGTVRDLTHLPALPFWQVDPSNLQSQAWANSQGYHDQSPGILNSPWRQSDFRYTNPFRQRGNMAN